ncbi:beta-N-acetylhexosaminidase [Acrocarpospora catenulata]|uniref:beta-N-acetylhexosaminidase n=1 Tax=Acrocarpospora catenulata TaxID=2836182 RepID=UPI001BDAEF14|nr:beta-N-acetylhexosaminidase [Acrocarpospora catenulata]
MIIPRPRELAVLGGTIAYDPDLVRLEPPDPTLGPEGYRLRIGPTAVHLTPGGPAGQFYARQTLVAYGERLPLGEIEDRPRFPWRGVMLDVARHFMPVDFVLRMIDHLAAHKLNVLQLHLTDDQGWRLEIKRHPRLTEVSGDHYSHDDIRAIVEYAAERFVRVVPEIGLPGHVQAALAAYPHLGNDPARRLPVWAEWGISPHTLNLEESTITFFEEVLDEVVELFPGPYVHVGGDECRPGEWEATPRAQERIRELGLSGAHAARGWITARMAEHLRRHDRRLVYWYDTDDGPSGATTMTWLDEESGPLATLEGRDVVLAPHRRTYFDYPVQPEPGPFAPDRVLTLTGTYHFDPPPEPPGAMGRIIGVQAQLWTEYLPTPADVERQTFPRLCAFAEVAWGSPRDYPDFLRRLDPHLARLAAQGTVIGPLIP